MYSKGTTSILFSSKRPLYIPKQHSQLGNNCKFAKKKISMVLRGSSTFQLSQKLKIMRQNGLQTWF